MKAPDFRKLLPQWLAGVETIVKQSASKSIQANQKADASPVTAYDRAIEALLRQHITKHYPLDGVIGEELPAIRPEAPRQWVIDPIDGTRAFLAGFPTYTTLIALIENGVPQLSAVYQPVTRELWLAEKGAATTLNGAAIRCRPCEKLEDAFFSTTSPFLFREADQPVVHALLRQTRTQQYGGDAYAYARLASGAIDLVVESGLKPYDFIALAPLIEGAGGIITDWNGNPLTLQSCGDVCAAGDKRVHEQALERLRQHG